MSLLSAGRPRWWTLTLTTLLVFITSGSLFWWRSAGVQMTVDGKNKRLAARHMTVGDLLKQEQIALGPDDFVTPVSTTTLTRSMPVKVTRVSRRIIEEVHETNPAIRWQLNTRTNLRRVLARKGYAKQRHETYRITTYDGQEVSRTLVKAREKRIPFFTLTLFNKQDEPIKTYDLLKAKTMKTVATAYYVGDPLVPGNVTFLGLKLRRGLVAVDPKVIPLRTRLYVPGYGYGYAADTGSRIKGNRIDLAVKDRKEERRYYMHRKMTVFILEKDTRW
jgi:3D (Asp-Asp-Asp) domain-containing protein